MQVNGRHAAHPCWLLGGSAGQPRGLSKAPSPRKATHRVWPHKKASALFWKAASEAALADEHAKLNEEGPVKACRSLPVRLIAPLDHIMMSLSLQEEAFLCKEGTAEKSAALQ